MKAILRNVKMGEMTVADVPPPALMSRTVLVRNVASLSSVGTERSVIELAKMNLAQKAVRCGRIARARIPQYQPESLMTERASEPQWIAVLTHANSEAKAEHHLRRQGFSVYLPRYLKLVRHAHRSDYLPRPLFPRYLFVDLSARASWRSILSTVGVSNIICAGNRLTNVPVPVIDEIRAREDQEGYVRLNRGRTFNRVEAIRVDLGSCNELDGLFESCDEHERVTILVRQVRARLPLEAIRATA